MAAARVVRNTLSATLRRNAFNKNFPTPTTLTRSLATPTAVNVHSTKSTTLKNGLTVWMAEIAMGGLHRC